MDEYLKQTKDFLDLVSTDNGIHEIRFFNSDGAQESIWFQSDEAGQVLAAAEHVHEAREENETGAFVSINPRTGTTPKTGRGEDHTNPGLFIVADFDDVTTLEAVLTNVTTTLIDGKNPTIILESSPGKFHCWFKLNRVPDSVTDWKELQKGLAHRLGSCKGILGLETVLRVPGVEHTKDEYRQAGVMPRVRLIEVNPDNIFEIDKLPRESVSAQSHEEFTTEDSSCVVEEGSMGDVTKDFLDIENIDSADLRHGSRNKSVRFSASDLSGRGWDHNEIREVLTEAAVERGLKNDKNLLRQINNGIDKPKIESSSEEEIELDLDDEYHFPKGSKSKRIKSHDDDDGPYLNHDLESIQIPDRHPTPEPPYIAMSCGLVGEIIQAVEPETEGSPAAVMTQFLTMVGNIAGKTAKIQGGGSYHYGNLFTMVVGPTSNGAKGDGLAAAKNIVRGIDPYWFDYCKPTRINSGEGMLEMFRDPDEDTSLDLTDPDEPQLESAVVDKRRCFELVELAGTLIAGKREGSTISQNLRDLFDCPDVIHNPTRKNPFQATDPFASVIGHVTPEELLDVVSSRDINGGLLNRFLFVWSERTRKLPGGGDLELMSSFTDEIKKSIQFMSGQDEVFRDKSANEHWNEWYYQYENTDRGLVEKVTTRSRPIIARLSLIIAMINRNKSITKPDLDAAMDLWRYSEDTARYVFGTSTVTMADRVMAVINQSDEGLTRTEILTRVGKSAKHHTLVEAIGALLNRGLITVKKESTGGKPREVYFKTTQTVIQIPSNDRDKVLDAIKASPGCTRSELSRKFRNINRMSELVHELIKDGLVVEQREETSGRPRTLLFPEELTPAKTKPRRKSTKKKSRVKTKTPDSDQTQLFSNNGQGPGEYEL